MTLWRGQHPLILASQSRARQTLLTNACIAFEAIPAEIDERGVQKASGLLAPDGIAALLAREKALSVSSTHPEKRWRLARGCSASQPAAPRPRSSCARLPASGMSCTPRLPLRPIAGYCSRKWPSRA
jgi:Maf-like protein